MQQQQTQGNQQIFWMQVRALTPLIYHGTLQQQSVERWIDKLWDRKQGGIDIKTAVGNVRYIHEFAAYVNKTCDELIADARQSKLTSTTNQFKWEEIIENYQKILVGKHSRSTAIEKLNKVRSFFSLNRVDLKYTPPVRGRPGKPFAPDRALLRKIFAYSDSIMRSWILTQSQSGLAEIDILMLDVDNTDESTHPSIRQQITNKEQTIYLRTARKKTGVSTETFLGEEAVAMLPNLSLKSTRLYALWRGQVDPGRTVRARFELMRDQLGIPQFSPHMLRRYFETTFEVAGINPLIIDLFMGHTSMKSGAFYTGPSIAQLKHLYLSVYPQLRLFPEFKPDELQRLTSLQIMDSGGNRQIPTSIS
ncbi:MAG: tyrosine-type recombinase/integrase [Nitrospiria bacterium]